MERVEREDLQTVGVVNNKKYIEYSYSVTSTYVYLQQGNKLDGSCSKQKSRLHSCMKNVSISAALVCVELGQ